MHINLSDDNFKELIGSLIGLIFLIVGYTYTKRNRKLYEKGVRVEGIVFSVERNDGFRFGNRVEPDWFVTLRYVTKDNLWVTKRYDEIGDGLSVSEGDRVKIIYNPLEPEEFVLDDGRSKYGPFLFMLIGVLFITVSVVAYLFNIEISN